MTREDDFIGQLEAYLEQYEGMTPLPSGVRDLVRAQLPGTRQIGGFRMPIRSRSLAIALVLLALLAISIGLAVAGGLLRKDRDDPIDRNPFALAAPLAQCDQTLGDGVVLEVTGFGAGKDWQDARELHAYQDGLVVIGPSASWGGSANTMDATWSQRRLTAPGAAHLLEGITNALPSCQAFAFDGQMGIRARTESGVLSVTLGVDVLETRATTPEQAAAVTALVDRLEDSDLRLSAADWAEADWHPYVPERWRFSLTFYSGDDPGFPPADGIVLPDGSSLQTFGTEEPLEAVDPAAVSPRTTMLRCAIVDAQEAALIAATLTDAGGALASPGGGWYFTPDAKTPNGIIAVGVVGLLPHEYEQDCLSGLVAPSTPTPEPPPSAPADEPRPFADACDYISERDVSEVIGSLDGATEHMTERSTDWALCWHPVLGNGLVTFSSRRPFPADSAAAQARVLFGDVGTTEQIAGHDVFFNACDDPAGQCRAAIAISAEPHFVVISWLPGSQATLRQLAERVIDLIDAGPAV